MTGSKDNKTTMPISQIGVKEVLKQTSTNENSSDTNPISINRNLTVNGTIIRLKSVFDGKLSLEKALGNLVSQKLYTQKSA